MGKHHPLVSYILLLLPGPRFSSGASLVLSIGINEKKNAVVMLQKESVMGGVGWGGSPPGPFQLP